MDQPANPQAIAVKAAAGPEGSRSPVGAGELVRLILWFGILAGLTEVALLGVQRYLMHRFIFLTRDVIWMAPLMDVSYGLVLGMILLAVARLRRRPLPFSIAVAALATLAALAVLFMYPRLHRGAEMLLAVGAGIQVARMAGRHRPAFRRLVRASVLPLVLLVTAAGLGLHGYLWWQERRAMAATPDASPGRPNVLLLILDTVRSTDLSLYGYPRPTTPRLERWARDGVVFNDALAGAPWTLPSHGVMFTGYWASQSQADWFNPLGKQHPTLAEVLRNHGYATAGFAANLLYCTWESGLTRGFTHYEAFPITVQQVLKTSSLVRVLTTQGWFKQVTGLRQRLARQSAADMNRDLLHWLDRDEAGRRPWFAFINYLDAHAPYLPPAPYDSLFPPVRPLRTHEVDDKGIRWTPETARVARDMYDRTLAYLDAQVGALLDSLRERGVLDSTLVIITSDHGEQFFEHGLMAHGNSLYRALLQVPLVIRWPGRVPSGVRVSAQTTNRDIPRTVMGLVGLHDSAGFPGRSLARFWGQGAGEAPSDTVLATLSFAPNKPKHLPVSRGDMAAVFAGGYHLIRNGDGVLELYDVIRDPGELTDLARDPAHSNRLDALGRILDSLAPAGSL